MIIVKAIIKFIFKIVGILLIILGQGLVLITTISSVLVHLFTGFLFLAAIAISFTDIDLGAKIFFWVIAIIFGAIATNILFIPEFLVNTGTYLMEYEF